MKKLMPLSLFLLLACLPLGRAAAEDASMVSYGKCDGQAYVEGVATPIDLEMKNFYVRTAGGNVEVKTHKDTSVGVQHYIRYPFKVLNRGGKLEFAIGKKKYSYGLPKQLYAKFYFKDWKAARDGLTAPQRYMTNGKIYVKPLADHLPTEKELWISGKLLLAEKGRELLAGDKKFTITGRNMAGAQGRDRLMGLLGQKDLKPFDQYLAVYGRMQGGVLIADEIAVMFRADSPDAADPKLGRILFIGDSISGNYDRGFRAALASKFNIYHPPVNCGPAVKGKQEIVNWLGAYDQPGRQWDVISFNFGQWDVKTSKASYQRNLRAVADALVKTKAKLIWVNTTPIPGGYGDIAGKPQLKGRDGPASPGKYKGVMRDYINPWAMEVMKDYPQISICDQHSMLWNEPSAQIWLKIAGTNRRGGIVDKKLSEDYGDNHIPGHLSIVIGRQLARLVLDVNGKKDVKLNPVEVKARDFGPKGRAISRNLDVADYKDLVSSDKRLRKYNTLSAARK
jgi:hypothetical protein